MLPWLAPGEPQFPSTDWALDDPNGLLAAGGELSPPWLLSAYPQGIFPWFNEGEPILWWSPSPRCVLFTDQFHCSRSLSKQMRKLDYEIWVDRQFTEVMRNCAAPRARQKETWISEAFITSYSELARPGVAHSIELYVDGELAGGLYGLAIGRLFFGESMFSKVKDASKICLYHLSKQLNAAGFEMIDCQVHNPHLESLGAVEIDRAAFAEYLKQTQHPAPAGLWTEKRWV